MKKLLFLNLHPLNKTGGGEIYTINTIKSCAQAGISCDLVAFSGPSHGGNSLSLRLDTPCVQAIADSQLRSPRPLSWGAALDRLPGYDAVWVQQYLGCNHVLDVITATTSATPLLFTNLGHEPFRDLFQKIYQPAGNHTFVEISNYALSRLPAGVPRALAPGAGVWSASLQPVLERPGSRDLTLLAVGRVLPHKGLEHTIRALGPRDRLHVVGPCPDDRYLDHLRQQAAGKAVLFHNEVAQSRLDELMRSADALVASSTHRLYDGRVIPQPELLGLVLLEAVAAGTPPVCSACPSFVEVMHSLGLDEWTYPENRPDLLRLLLDKLRETPPPSKAGLISSAQTVVRRAWLWDDYWERVAAHVAC